MYPIFVREPHPEGLVNDRQLLLQPTAFPPWPNEQLEPYRTVDRSTISLLHSALGKRHTYIKQVVEEDPLPSIFPRLLASVLGSTMSVWMCRSRNRKEGALHATDIRPPRSLQQTDFGQQGAVGRTPYDRRAHVELVIRHTARIVH
jgi:hypothetical protein